MHLNIVQLYFLSLETQSDKHTHSLLQMDSRPSVLILGHSFVRRFHEFLKQNNDSRISSDMQLNSVANVSLHGVGGRTVQKITAYDMHFVKRTTPDYVILELGTNDLAALPPKEAAFHKQFMQIST